MWSFHVDPFRTDWETWVCFHFHGKIIGTCINFFLFGGVVHSIQTLKCENNFSILCLWHFINSFDRYMWIKFLEQCSKHKSLHGVTFNQIQYYIDIMGKWWYVLSLSPQSYNNLQLSSNTVWHHHVNNLQTWKCDVMGQFCWTGAGGASHFLYQGLKGCLLVNSEPAWREELDSGFL